ncbi:MAG TPA: lipoprotein-releasing ABC transporter permease subunit [Nitrospirales bacterium]|nr:lipoprotein-releasing ABC transporter permease subunit [Nitrospirales bacterium]
MNLPYEFSISFRYLRSKHRQHRVSFNTVISIVGVTLGVAALIATLGIMTGFKEDVQKRILGTKSHVVVVDRTGGNLSEYEQVLEKVTSVPHVVAASPFIYRQILLTSEFGVQGVLLNGIDPSREGQVTDVGKNLIVGSLDDLKSPQPTEDSSSPDDILPGIIVGKELSRVLQVTVGDRLNVVSPVGSTRIIGATPKIRGFRLTGIFDSGMYEYDTSLAYIALSDAQKFFAVGDTVSGVAIKVDQIFLADQIADTIDQSLGFPFWARDWMELNRNLFSALKMEKLMMFIILVLIILVASFNIVSTLMMIVVEKGREIAILKTMGATSQAVMRIFMLDGLIIGIAGIVLGIPLGYSICWAIQTFYTFPTDVYYISRIPVEIRAFDVLAVGLSAVFISLLATIYPSRQAAKLDPAVALRYE